MNKPKEFSIKQFIADYEHINLKLKIKRIGLTVSNFKNFSFWFFFRILFNQLLINSPEPYLYKFYKIRPNFDLTILNII